MKQVDFLKKLRELNKSFYTVSDIQAILGKDSAVVRNEIRRLIGRGSLKRLGRNVYVSPFQHYDIEEIACQLHLPCYLSFETALSRYGILSQVPYTITFATTRRSKKIMLGGREVEYRHLDSKLFFGYKLLDHLQIAEPEKALLDQLYLVSLGKGTLHPEELTLSELSRERFWEYAKRFPLRTQRKAKGLKSFWGQVPEGVK